MACHQFLFTCFKYVYININDCHICFVFVLSYFRMQKNTASRHHDFITEAPLGGHGHADAGGYTLPQWACRHLHAARLAELGVARAARTQPATKADSGRSWQIYGDYN
jgi:hypothetical protein